MLFPSFKFMKYWENGFYLQQNLQNTRKEISDEKWSELLKGQSEGKEIFTDIDGYPRLRNHIETEEEYKEKRIYQIKQRLTAISEDIIQDLAGEMVENIESKKQEFISLHNEIRTLLNKLQRRLK